MRVYGQTGGCAELHCTSHQRKRCVYMDRQVDARSYTAHHTRGRDACVWTDRWMRGVTLRITPEEEMRVYGQTGGCAELHCASHQRKRCVYMDRQGDARSYTAHDTRGRDACIWTDGDARSYTAHHTRGRDACIWTDRWMRGVTLRFTP